MLFTRFFFVFFSQSIYDFRTAVYYCCLYIKLNFEKKVLIEIITCGLSANETMLDPSYKYVKGEQYGLRLGALSHTEQQAITVSKMTSVKKLNRKTNV